MINEEVDDRTSTITEDEEENFPPYELALTEIPISIKDGRDEFTIICKRPTRPQHEKRLRMSVIVKRTAAKVDDQEAVTVFNDSARADEVFVRAVALRVIGYKLTEDSADDTVLDAQMPLDPHDYLTEEEIEHWEGERDKDKQPVVRVIDLIPATHLKVVANDLFGGTFDVEKARKRVLSSRAQRLHTVTQKLGVHTLEDSTMSKPSHLIKWRFKDPDFKALGKFDSRAVTGTTVFLTGGGTEEHRLVSLDTCETLFDAHVDSAENATVNGEEFDAHNPAHVAKVDYGLKKTLVMMLFNKIQAESGNSSAPSSNT